MESLACLRNLNYVGAPGRAKKVKGGGSGLKVLGKT